MACGAVRLGLLSRRRLLVCWLGLCSALGAAADPGPGADPGQQAPAAAQESAPEKASALLERMAEAVRSLNFEGTLVYLHQNRLEAMSLQHRIDQGEVQERLVSLSGPVRAVVRARERVMCVLPDGHPISVEQAKGILDTEGIDPAALTDHYRVELLGVARVAGRDTDVVGIIPRDALRYGYRFHIDRETALPLKSDLIDQRQEPLEQLMFTSIAFQPADGSVPGRSAQPLLRSAPATSAASRWHFGETPAGFELVMHHEMRQPDGSTIEHFMFTDRLSAYSVYVDQDEARGLQGVASIGAVHAAGRSLDGYQLVAVGEVPAETVQAAVAAAELRPAVAQDAP